MSECVLKLLRDIDPFPARKDGRKSVMQPGQDRVRGFALGTVRKLDEGLVPSQFNARFPELLKLARKMMHDHDPTFRFSSIQVNKNQVCAEIFARCERSHLAYNQENNLYAPCEKGVFRGW